MECGIRICLQADAEVVFFVVSVEGEVILFSIDICIWPARNSDLNSYCIEDMYACRSSQLSSSTKNSSIMLRRRI